MRAADKVGSVAYDAGGRNDFLGNGRLNIVGALALLDVEGLPTPEG